MSITSISPYAHLKQLSRNNNPFKASIELTSRCNAACPYCYVKNEASVEDLSTQQVFQILDKLADAGICYLTITGGEPFLRNDIHQIIAYAFQKQFWGIGFLSNGTLITNDHIKTFQSHSSFIRFFQFSIFSINPKTHDSYVGITGACQKVLEIAEILKNKGFNVTFALNVLDQNKESITETYNFLSQTYRVGLSIHRFINRSSNSSEKQDNHSICSESYYNQIIPFLPPKILQSEAKHLMQSINAPINLDSPKSCNGIYYSINIDSNGMIHPCIAFRNLTIGSIFDKLSLQQILKNSKQFQALKNIHSYEINPCNKCNYLNACLICMGQNHTLHDSIVQQNPQTCNYIKSITRNKEFLRFSNIKKWPDTARVDSV